MGFTVSKARLGREINFAHGKSKWTISSLFNIPFRYYPAMTEKTGVLASVFCSSVILANLSTECILCTTRYKEITSLCTSMGYNDLSKFFTWTDVITALEFLQILLRPNNLIIYNVIEKRFETQIAQTLHGQKLQVHRTLLYPSLLPFHNGYQ